MNFELGKIQEKYDKYLIGQFAKARQSFFQFNNIEASMHRIAIKIIFTRFEFIGSHI